MAVSLSTAAEVAAQKCQTLPAYGRLNLLHVKRQLAQLLTLIGRDGIFDEYTLHDISHVEKMLSMLDWLIPDSTKRIMTPTDWLLSVLGIYFHDVGMLVTKQEYQERESSDFPDFRDTVLFTGDQGEDYRHKIDGLPDEERERFLYQEFVRHSHAERVGWWITGEAPAHLGIADQAAREVDTLLRPLGSQFRRDLGIVAESHHADTLDDFQKYKVSQPYGDSEAETGNLHYAALLLRASDLLHITSDRTPAIAFRLINPVDPLSQQEWAKQMAVKRVRPKIGQNKDGEPDPSAPRDTIEIHAYFKREDGFFGLTSYLGYAAAQLAKCHAWASSANRKTSAPHEFPWSKLDDSDIETEGFIRDTFQFTIDQARILDLLTGHTLYNDSSVVLRELVQNCLDAIRLRHYDNPGSAPGEVIVQWNSKERSLTVSDNGTGMTQQIIGKHLLRVGASLYQDPDFKKSHPDFSSISRFGIGVLSTFMIADTVEIRTCHEDEDKARRLALRSVHGKYLIRLLEKHTQPASSLAPHGTLFRLQLRHSVQVPDILKAVQYWIVIPGCKVSVVIDEQQPINVGFKSPKDAVVTYLRSAGRRVVESTQKPPNADGGEPPVSVVEYEIEGTSIAYAVEWSPYFHEWSFLDASALKKDIGLPPIGNCIEGVRVDTNTPGFTGSSMLALANATGDSSPKTNVARSGLEATPERDAMLRNVYAAYCGHVENEISNLTKVRGHSLTWAAQEAQFLLSPLISPPSTRRNGRVDAVNVELLEASIQELPILLTEKPSGRETVSCASLRSEKKFWTIECSLFNSAERLIRETSANTSIRSVISALGADIELPQDRLLCRSTGYLPLHSYVFHDREIAKIIVRREQRRLDMMWQKISEPPRWLTLPKTWRHLYTRILEDFTTRSYRRLWDPIGSGISILQGGVSIVGIANEMAIRQAGGTLLVGDCPAIAYIKPKLEAEIQKGRHAERLPAVVGILALFETMLYFQPHGESLEHYVRRFNREFLLSLGHGTRLVDSWEQELNDKQLLTAMAETDWSFFDTSMWERR